MDKLKWSTLSDIELMNEKNYIIAISGTFGKYTTVAAWFENDGIFMNDFDDSWDSDEIEYIMEFPRHPDEF